MGDETAGIDGYVSKFKDYDSKLKEELTNKIEKVITSILRSAGCTGDYNFNVWQYPYGQIAGGSATIDEFDPIDSE